MTRDALCQLESVRVILVTQTQLERIEDAWGLCAYHNARKISAPHLVAWFEWAVYRATGIDVRDVPVYTFEVAKA
jgi:hypothetical protein